MWHSYGCLSSPANLKRGNSVLRLIRLSNLCDITQSTTLSSFVLDMQIPPLAALRAFEASARHMNFTKAADELFVTQSAVSRHVRMLEDMLNVPLFVRVHRGLKLTPEGETLLADLDDTFRRLSWAVERVRRAGRGQEILHIHSYTTIAICWLIPRLPRFKAAHPQIELRLTVANVLTWNSVAQQQVHGVICNDPGASPDDALKLMGEKLIAVCSPAYREQHFPQGRYEDLNDELLIHCLATPLHWLNWLQGVGRAGLNLNRGFRFESGVMTLAAAERGLGVAITQPEFVAEPLQKGSLVQPFDARVETERSCYFVPVAKRTESSAVNLFRNWLAEEVRIDG